MSLSGGALFANVVSVVLLVAETVGVDAASDPELDWRRYGPELATVLLEAQLAGSFAPEDDATRHSAQDEAAAGPALPLSESLAGAIGNPRLRDHLGLDDDLAAEVGRVQRR